MHKKSKGFTLIEILIVIGIIAILAAIVIIAINPAKQFAQARNTQRQSNVDTILNAIGQRIADNKGVFGGTLGGRYLPGFACRHAVGRYYEWRGESSAASQFLGAPTAGIDLSCLTPTYIPSFPTDPDTSFATALYTGYDVSVDTVGRVSICASRGLEASIPGSAAICVKR